MKKQLIVFVGEVACQIKQKCRLKCETLKLNLELDDFSHVGEVLQVLARWHGDLQRHQGDTDRDRAAFRICHPNICSGKGTFLTFHSKFSILYFSFLISHKCHFIIFFFINVALCHVFRLAVNLVSQSLLCCVSWTEFVLFASYTNLPLWSDLCFHSKMLDLYFYEGLYFDSVNKREKCFKFISVWGKRMVCSERFYRRKTSVILLCGVQLS